MNEESITRLTGGEREAIEVFRQRLDLRFPGEILQVILFGSKARGDSGVWSDIDLLIVVREESWPLRGDVSMLAADVSLEYDVLLGPRVIGLERWERMKALGFGLFRSIMAEGIPLTPLPAAG